MDKDLKGIANKFLRLVTLYIRTRIASKISIGFIAGGISILGFNNFIPYMTVIIRPELVDKIELANNSQTFLGALMIFIGASVPLVVRISNYYRDAYLHDLRKINEIYAIADYDTFIYQMDRIANNASILEYEINLIENFFIQVLSTNFYFNDSKANELAKKLGNELSNFNTEMAMRLSPSDTNPRLYTHPRHLATYDRTAREIRDDCKRLATSYHEMKQQFDVMKSKKLMRYFK